MKWKQWLIAASFIFSLTFSEKAAAQVSMSISISARMAPPPLPVYVQPVCPADGYLWTPGYWAYTDDGYYWVPGVWVIPPQPGYLWTPCYWGYSGGVYGYHPGYWGTHVGFYGGVNYGYGYGGSGFGGGRWEGGSFRYNTAVMNVNRTVVHNTYVDNTVIVHNTTVINNRTSYNGGPGGLAARPSAREQTAMNEHHVQATSQQSSHMQTAARDRSQFVSVNHGKPATTALNTVGGQRFNQQGHGPEAGNMHNQVQPHVASQRHTEPPHTAAHLPAICLPGSTVCRNSSTATLNNHTICHSRSIICRSNNTTCLNSTTRPSLTQVRHRMQLLPKITRVEENQGNTDFESNRRIGFHEYIPETLFYERGRRF